VNRSLSLFLAFLVLLAAVVTAGVWRIGWNLLGLAFDGDRRGAPYGLLLLSRSGGDEPDDQQQVLELLAADGGEAVWQARTLSLVDGSLRDDWQRLTLVRFERGAGVTRALTGADLRALLAEQNRLRHPRRRLLGSAALVEAPRQTGVVLLGLFVLEQAGPVPARELGFTTALETHGGRLLWQGGVTGLVGESGWEQALLVGFPAMTPALQWLQDARVETALALGARHYRDRVLLLAAPQPWTAAGGATAAGG